MKKFIIVAALIAIVAIGIAIVASNGDSWADTLFKMVFTDDGSAVKKWTGGGH